MSRPLIEARKHWGSALALPRVDSLLPATNQEVARSSRAGRTTFFRINHFHGSVSRTEHLVQKQIILHVRDVASADACTTLRSRSEWPRSIREQFNVCRRPCNAGTRAIILAEAIENSPQPGLWCRQPPRLARRGYGQACGWSETCRESSRVASMGPRHSNGDHAG